MPEQESGAAQFGPLMADMTWEEVREAAAEGFAVLLPVGSTEQHGPHLPLATDVLIPLAVARGVAERTPTLVAPPIAYGYQSKPLSGGGQSFPGTASLRGSTFVSMLREILGELVRSGFRNLVLQNWHYENAGFTYEAADLAVRDAGDTGVRVVVIDNPLALVDQAEVQSFFPGDFPGYDVEHAAVIETSLMLALHPELVRRDRIADDRSERHPPYDMIPAPRDTIPASGVLYRATLAREETGHRIYEMLVEGVAAAVELELLGEEGGG